MPCECDGPARQPSKLQDGVQFLGEAPSAITKSPTNKMRMSSAYEKLRSHLTDKQIGYWSNDEERAVCVDFPGIVGWYRLFARADSDEEFHVFGQLRIDVPHGSRKAVAEVIERANYRQAGGEFEMNFSEDELRFHVSESLSDGELQSEMIDRLIEAARNALDSCLAAVLSVIFGNEQPEDAVGQIVGANG